MSNSERNGKETSVRHELWSDKTMTVLEKKERREVVKKGGVRITFSYTTSSKRWELGEQKTFKMTE